MIRPISACYIFVALIFLTLLLVRRSYVNHLYRLFDVTRSSVSSLVDDDGKLAVFSGLSGHRMGSSSDPFSASLTSPVTHPTPGHSFFLPSANSPDVCGYSSRGSWQDAFVQVHEEVLSGKRPPKAIVWACDLDFGLCGGLGDRFRGLVLGMYLAAVSGRAFFVHHNFPTRLEYAFMPNRIAWNTEAVTDHMCTMGQGKPGCYRGNAKSADGSPPESQFEKVFFKWEGPNTPKLNETINVYDIDAHGASPWPTAFLDSLPWSEPVIIFRSNRVTPMYRKRFIEDLLHYVDSHSNKLPWKDLVDDPLMQQLRDGLKRIPTGYGMGCSMRFLFVPSPGLVSEANKMVLGLFSADSTLTPTTKPVFSSTFPERSFYYSSLNPSATGRGPNLSITEHLRQSGHGLMSADSVTANYVVGVHVRLVKDDSGKMFGDTGGARYTMDDLYAVMECAKALVDQRKWPHNEVVYILFSDSAEFRKHVLTHYKGTVFVDPSAKISHVDRWENSHEDIEISKFQSTMAELMVLSVSDALTLTYSGFGNVAQDIGLISEEGTAASWSYADLGFQDSTLALIAETE
eukprot:GHVQ01004789.1.p1 GENE.GHVQ01004789.1~~GHVQ01004789.1.p1  ORF type:complete len:572 (-),score=34.55 GHVQ01004789.1:586-2301(-)